MNEEYRGYWVDYLWKHSKDAQKWVAEHWPQAPDPIQQSQCNAASELASQTSAPCFYLKSGNINTFVNWLPVFANLDRIALREVFLCSAPDGIRLIMPEWSEFQDRRWEFGRSWEAGTNSACCQDRADLLMFPRTCSDRSKQKEGHYRFIANFLGKWLSVSHVNIDVCKDAACNLKGNPCEIVVAELSIRWLSASMERPGRGNGKQKEKSFTGFVTSREKGTLPRFIPALFAGIYEQRASFRLVATFERLPIFSLLTLMDENNSFAVWHEPKRWAWSHQMGEMVHMYALQMMVVHLINVYWAKGWEKVLNSIDEYLKVEIKDVLDDKAIEELMFDNSEFFAQSHTCWLLLHLLRVSSEWISETKRAIQVLCETKASLESLDWHALGIWSLEAYEVLGEGWKRPSSFSEKTEKRLQDRITAQVEELKGKRDSAVFSAPLMQDAGWTRAKSQYAITTIAVAVGTYVIAGALLLLVDRKKKVAEYVSESATSWRANLTNIRRKAAPISAAESKTKAKEQEITISGIFQSLHTMA
ncbi:hypothetical protein B0T22DRAFT_537612 [Podospora appendiculata]|uniref:Uncharacterized protein n=1 Tax=Podospora appendiculata TaxID=314037 RepID=A0AAE1CA75_9PEZI|nr:hypothetical protein B0T22DRAFT_537612 [Podospora appendiculata]